MTPHAEAGLILEHARAVIGAAGAAHDQLKPLRRVLIKSLRESSRRLADLLDERELLSYRLEEIDSGIAAAAADALATCDAIEPPPAKTAAAA